MSAREEFRTESSDAEIWSSCKLLVTSQAGTGAESLGEYFPTFRKILVTPSSGSSRPKAPERGQQIKIDLCALHRDIGWVAVETASPMPVQGVNRHSVY
jgi:hypothetical protein